MKNNYKIVIVLGLIFLILNLDISFCDWTKDWSQYPYSVDKSSWNFWSSASIADWKEAHAYLKYDEVCKECQEASPKNVPWSAKFIDELPWWQRNYYYLNRIGLTFLFFSSIWQLIFLW
jgi:hypothetical protein